MAAAQSMRRTLDSENLEVLKTPTQLLLEKASPYILAIVLAFGLSELTVTSLRDQFLPKKAPPSRPPRVENLQLPTKSSYQIIASRNLFNMDGVIPEALSAKGDKGQPGGDQAPVLSQLPLTLVGTVVLTNPEKSIANIEVKSKNQVVAVMVGHDIDTLAKLKKVERNKAIFLNNNNGRMEYIENKPTTKLAFSGAAAPEVSVAKGDVKQIAPNHYKLQRASLLRHTQDLSKLLMQASTTARKKSNGEIECYVLTSFQPDSVFADLGVQQGDCIKSVNGEPIDSPAKAMEIYNALKNANTIKITVESDGRDIEKEYNIE